MRYIFLSLLVTFVSALLANCVARSTVDRDFIDPKTRVTPSGLTYSSNPATYVQNATITTNSATLAEGAATSFSVSPSLPSGLTLDTSSGAITGTATVATGATNYTITAKNDAGQTSASLSITLLASPKLILDTDTGVAGVQTTSMSFGTLAPNQTRQLQINLSNPSSAGLAYDWTLSESLSYLSASATSGSVNPNANANINITIDTTGLSNGNYSGSFAVNASTAGTTNASQTVNFTFSLNSQIFVAVGAGGKIWRSADGDTWTAVTSPTGNTLCNVVFAGDRFVAVGISGTAVYSTDATATTWQLQSPGGSNHMFDLIYDGTKVVASGGNFSFGVSPLATRCSNSAADSGNERWYNSNVSGASWTGANFAASSSPQAIAYGGGKYVTVNYSDVWTYSTDGVSFSTRSSQVQAGGASQILFDVAANLTGSVFVAVGTNTLTGLPSTSTNIYNTSAPATDAGWSSSTGTATGQYYIVVEFLNNQFVVAGYNGKIGYSTSGSAFNSGADLPGAYTIRALAYGAGKYVIAGDSGNVHYTTSGTFASYTAATALPGAATVYGLAFGP
jgi:hypothetical protein